MKYLSKFFVSTLLFVSLFMTQTVIAQSSQDSDEASQEFAEGVDTCEGSFVNPFSDVCWSCVLPISLGPVDVFKSNLPNFGDLPSPICACTTPVPRIGVSFGIWEPVRLVDVVEEDWCFAQLGGLKLDPGIGFSTRAVPSEEGSQKKASFHAHWYVYPVFAIFELLQNFACMEVTGFDIGYVTEFDPTWVDDSLTLILNPEALLFANPIAQAACVADCASTARGFAEESLFWCMGCNGSTFMTNGNVSHKATTTQSAVLVAQRMAFKIHRSLVAFETWGAENACQPGINPILDKRGYRVQMTNPTPHLRGPFICPVMGESTAIYENFKTFPVVKENHGFLMFRKRTCCVL